MSAHEKAKANIVHREATFARDEIRRVETVFNYLAEQHKKIADLLKRGDDIGDQVVIDNLFNIEYQIGPALRDAAKLADDLKQYVEKTRSVYQTIQAFEYFEKETKE